MGRWVMENVVVNLRSTFVLLASMLGFAAQAAAYVPLPGDAPEVAEVATDDVYRTGTVKAPPIAVERPIVVEVRDVSREEPREEPAAAQEHAAEQAHAGAQEHAPAQEHDRTSWRDALRIEQPARAHLAVADPERRQDRHAELARAVSGGEDLAGSVTP